VLITLLFIFLEFWTIFSASKLLSAWKIEFQDYLYQVMDIENLKNNFYILHRLKMSFQALLLLNRLLDTSVLKIRVFLKNLNCF